jgi:hypothetical protein
MAPRLRQDIAPPGTNLGWRTPRLRGVAKPPTRPVSSWGLVGSSTASSKLQRLPPAEMRGRLPGHRRPFLHRRRRRTRGGTPSTFRLVRPLARISSARRSRPTGARTVTPSSPDTYGRPRRSPQQSAGANLSSVTGLSPGLRPPELRPRDSQRLEGPDPVRARTYARPSRARTWAAFFTWPGHLASSLRGRPGHTAPTARCRRQRTQLERLQEGPHLGEGAAEHPVEVAGHGGDDMGVHRGSLLGEALDGRD